MPNWVYNSLIIEGDSALIADVKRILNRPYVKKHDQWNSETGKMEIKDYTYSNPVFAFHNIYNHIQDNVPDEVYIQQPDHSLPLAEALKFEGNHWYDWNVRNWGTKWDVGVSDEEKYPETELYTDTEDTISYSFNTAWSPPLPAIEKLVEQYPNLNFTLSYEEETGWGGEISWEEGVEVSKSEYGWKCRECDHEEDETPYCEDCDYDTCPSCGYGEPDEACEKHKESINA
ncbi:MAG: hypothetical protein EBU08_22490 [Micrococcales bacterium]|jgi:hypothetical protein|nr:hypothetical protein [Micrococcales bacterium]